MELVFVRDVAGVDPEDARQRATEHLRAAGYRPIEGASASAFERGGALSGLFAMSMDRLRTEVRLEAALAEAGAGGARLTLRYRVNDFGQFITATNRRFWDIEADEVADHARGVAPDEARRKRYEADARRDARRFLIVSTVLAAAISGLIIGLAFSLFAPPA